MTTHKDTDLREALRRRYADTPQLPADFMNRMQQAAQPKRHHSSLFTRRITIVFSIAAVLLIAFLLWPEKQETPITQPEAQPIIAEVNPQPVPKPIVEEEKEEVLAEVQPTKQPVKKRKKAVRKQSTSIEEPVEEIMPAEPVEELTIAIESPSDSYAAIEAEMLVIRRRGERIEAMVADMIRSY